MQDLNPPLSIAHILDRVEKRVKADRNPNNSDAMIELAEIRASDLARRRGLSIPEGMAVHDIRTPEARACWKATCDAIATLYGHDADLAVIRRKVNIRAAEIEVRNAGRQVPRQQPRRVQGPANDA